ncbi:ABC transporter permease [Natronosalvus halobius]|uniref:ABC transporter permease n=1 Tax=Natronosalvus halobius TaxID=2953746 RepID=UPI00209F9BF2|nr:ABC transporter permease [Natronosalvus halobius]USZ73693.1 ABC transporter permease [Natronosalvus halobius]
MTLSFSALLGKIEVNDATAGRVQKLAAAVILLFLYAPIVIVIMLSFTPTSTPTFPMEGVSLQWYEALIQDTAMMNALQFSAQLAFVSAICSGVIGILAAFGIVRSDFGNSILDEGKLRLLFSLPLIIPWIITGIGGLVFFNVIGLFGSFWSYLIGHILITLPFTTLVVAAGLDGFDISLEEAARNLGATRWRAYFEVTLPMIMPSIIAALLFAFILSFNNFIHTFFWLSFSDQTLPVYIFGLIRRTYDPTLNAIGTILIVFSLAVTITAERLSRRLLT